MLQNAGFSVQTLVGGESTHPPAPVMCFSVPYNASGPLQIRFPASAAGSEAGVTFAFWVEVGATRVVSQVGGQESMALTVRLHCRTDDSSAVPATRATAIADAERKALENKVSSASSSTTDDTVLAMVNEKVDRALDVASAVIIEGLVKRIESGLLDETIDELVQGAVDANVCGMRSDIQMIESSLSEIDLEDLDSRVDDMECTSSALKARLDALIEENEALCASLDELSARVGRIEAPRRAPRSRRKSGTPVVPTSTQSVAAFDGTK